MRIKTTILAGLVALVAFASSANVSANAKRFAIWDTGDTTYEYTVAPTQQESINIWLVAHPGSTWIQWQAQGYTVREYTDINP